MRRGVRLVRKLALSAVALLSLGAADPTAHHPLGRCQFDARVVPAHFTSRFYEVEGDSLEAAARFMRDHGPLDQRGVRRVALTSWQLTWEWPLREGQAVVHEASVRLAGEVVLPRWSQGEHDPRYAQEWRRFVEATACHELGHVEIALRGAQQLESSFRRISPNRRADWREGNRLGYTAVSALNDRDLHYDRDTVHGRAQGVLLP